MIDIVCGKFNIYENLFWVYYGICEREFKFNIKNNYGFFLVYYSIFIFIFFLILKWICYEYVICWNDKNK